LRNGVFTITSINEIYIENGASASYYVVTITSIYKSVVVDVIKPTSAAIDRVITITSIESK
jgi:hypothetical protein